LELWQGPAPRRPYTDNIHPYNWHWFRLYGAGEALNNGTHEIDVCRWAMGVDYPQRITSSGGRYHFKDDWQFYDTLVTSFDYGDKMISWEGNSCSGMRYYGRDRGSTILGTTGSILIDGNGYEVYDLKGNKLSEIKAGNVISSSDLMGRDTMTDAHFANFIAAIRKGEKLNSPIEIGNVDVTILQLSNIAWEVSRELRLDTTDGKILNDAEAMKLWGANTRRAGNRISEARKNLKYARSCKPMKQTLSRRNFVQSGALIAMACAAPNAALAEPGQPLESRLPFILAWPATPSATSPAPR